MIQSQLQAQGEIAIRAAEKIQIDIKEVNQQSVSQTIDAMVQADPQLAWLKEMEQRGDVDWHQVKELHDSFKYSNSGMSGALAIVIAIIVTYFTAGAASGLVAGAASGAGATTVATGTMWAAGTGASLAGAGWANIAVTTALTGMASNTAIGTINNKGDLGAGLKDATTSDALKGYVVSGVTAGLTAGVYDKWTGTQTGASNTAAASNNTGVLANSGKVVVEGGLSTWSGVGQFATNQALQNGTSAVLNKALGQDGSLGDALTSTLANTFAAAGFNWVGDISVGRFENGSLTKIGLHAIMGGLAAEAAGGDFKIGALAAGANEALIDTLAKQYGSMDTGKRNGLLVMNSQVLGVLTAAIQGGDDKALQIGSSVAGNATKYNFLGHESQELREKARKEVEESGDVNASQLLMQLEKSDQYSDVLLGKYTTKPESLTTAELNDLATYLHVYAYEQTRQYGADVSKNLVNALLTEGHVFKDYTALYALNSSSEVRKQESAFNRENRDSLLGQLFWQRDIADNELTYNKAQGSIKTHNIQQGEANLGMPALYVMSGPLGAVVRVAAAMDGAGQLAYGVEQAIDGDAWNAASNIVQGTLGVAFGVGKTAKPVVGNVVAKPKLDDLVTGKVYAPKGTGTTGSVVANEATNANAQAALRAKLSGLQKAQETAAITKTLPDGRVRYYTQQVPARTVGITRGASFVTELDPKTGNTRQWMESYNQSGSVIRVHPKSINGQPVDAQHYPPTGAELKSWGQK